MTLETRNTNDLEKFLSLKALSGYKMMLGRITSNTPLIVMSCIFSNIGIVARNNKMTTFQILLNSRGQLL